MPRMVARIRSSRLDYSDNEMRDMLDARHGEKYGNKNCAFNTLPYAQARNARRFQELCAPCRGVTGGAPASLTGARDLVELHEGGKKKRTASLVGRYML